MRVPYKRQQKNSARSSELYDVLETATSEADRSEAVSDLDGWQIGNVGGYVLVRAIKHGKTVHEATFAPADALILADKIVQQVHVLRPPPRGTRLRRVK
jgi:hypothetical protein